MNKQHRVKGLPLKVAILENGMIQREVAAKIGLVLSTFNMKLLGERPFSDEEKQQLCQILDRPMATLFPDEDIKDEQNTQTDLAASR